MQWHEKKNIHIIKNDTNYSYELQLIWYTGITQVLTRGTFKCII